MSTVVVNSTDTKHAAATGKNTPPCKRSRKLLTGSPEVEHVSNTLPSILHRFMQLGVSARCTYLGSHLTTGLRCLGHNDTTEAELRSTMYDLQTSSPLLWGDTTQLSTEAQAKLLEEVGEATPTKEPWRGTLFTWLPDAYVSIALLQVDGGFTLVYMPCFKEFYFASDVTMLPRGTPIGTVLIGVYTEDERAHFRVPRVLIHDVLAWGDAIETTRTPLEQRAAIRRYKLLREHLLPLITNQRYLVLQWCGFLTAAKKFLNGTLAVGHRVGGLVAILDGAAGAPCALSQTVAQGMQEKDS